MTRLIVVIEEKLVQYFRCGGCGEENILPDDVDDEKYKCGKCQKMNMIDFDEAGLDDSDDILDDGNVEIGEEDIDEAIGREDGIIDDTEM